MPNTLPQQGQPDLIHPLDRHDAQAENLQQQINTLRATVNQMLVDMSTPGGFPANPFPPMPVP